MKIIKSKKTLEKYIEKTKKDNKKIGFAPTMGALHEGHLSLYEAAKKDNDVIISSIFVNPTQFNNSQDLEKYPKTLEKDLEMLKSVNVDTVYVPDIEDLYPEGLIRKKYDFGGLENEMEGKFRPGHFDGVGTVVEALFNQIKPDNAYFGEKDFQQLAIIKKMTEKLKIPTKIIGVPTLRESNGLAMSSRNMRLSEEQKQEATIIYQTLSKVNEWFRIISIPEIKARVEDIFKKSHLTLEYFIIADEESLKETDFFYPEKKYRAFIVAFSGDVRLIDNLGLS